MTMSASQTSAAGRPPLLPAAGHTPGRDVAVPPGGHGRPEAETESAKGRPVTRHQQVESLRPLSYVWVAQNYLPEVIYHAVRSHHDSDVEITRAVYNVGGTREEHTAVMPPWAFTVCGVLTHEPTWEPGWSDQQEPHRFAAGSTRGLYVPLRLLNPAVARPCRRCFTESD